jgi:hypothetical protein
MFRERGTVITITGVNIQSGNVHYDLIGVNVIKEGQINYDANKFWLNTMKKWQIHFFLFIFFFQKKFQVNVPTAILLLLIML